MSDEYENKSGYQAQSSETISGSGSGVTPVSYTHLTLPTIPGV